MPSVIVGLCGRKRSGKDTLAEELVERYGYTRVAFADPLREMLLALDPVVEQGDYTRTLRVSDMVATRGWEDAKAHPEVLKRVFAQLQQAGSWLKGNPRDAAQVLGPLWGNLDVATVEAANAHRSYQVQAVNAGQLGEQQKIADAFFAAGLLPKAVDAKDVDIWKP